MKRKLGTVQKRATEARIKSPTRLKLVFDLLFAQSSHMLKGGKLSLQEQEYAVAALPMLIRQLPPSMSESADRAERIFLKDVMRSLARARAQATAYASE